MKTAILIIALGSCLPHPVGVLAGQVSSPALTELQNDARAGAELAVQTAPASNRELEEISLYKFSELRLEEEANRRTLALYVMGAALLALLFVLAIMCWRQAPAETLVSGSGLVLVIFATVLVIILAKVDQQLTAATGILGAIAGYLFGKTTK